MTPWPGCSEPPGSWHPQPARWRAPVPSPACVRGVVGAAGRGLCSTGEAFPGATGSRAQAAPSAVLFGRGSCFFEHEIRNLERILQPQGGFWQASDRAGVWSSGSCPPLWPVSPAVPAGCLHAVPFSVTQPRKGAGVSVPATCRQAAREHPPRLVGRQSQEPAALYSAETRSDGARAASKSLGGKC